MNAPSPKPFQFSCPACLRPIKASAKAAGKSLPCPGCGKMITVPAPEEAKWDAVHEPLSEDEYGVAEPVNEGPRYTTPIVPGWGGSELDDDAYGETYKPPASPDSREFEEDEKFVIPERPKLPPHPMVTGIFTIFADATSIVWFCVLSLMIAVFVGTAVLPTMMLLGVLPVGLISYVMTMLCCGFSAVVGMGVLLFASNCFLSILQDSAAGNRLIESWPNKAGGGFNLAGMFFVLAALFFGAVIGLGISILLPDVHWIIIQIIVIFCTFPFFLVSCLENDSLMFPVSTITVRSVFARFSTWATFYLEAAVLAGIACGATTLIVYFVSFQLKTLSFACGIILGPLLTFLFFIYFRLLGRLVWVCDEWFRSLEPEEEEDEDDEEEGEFEKG